MRLRTVLLGLVLALLPSSAFAAGSPNISLSKSAQSEVLYGNTAPVQLRATNPAGQPYGYNLSFRDILPPGVDLASSPAPSVAPDIVIPRVDGSTVLIWSNVADLAPGSSFTITYSVTHETTGADGYDVPDTYQNNAAAYLHTNPRVVPLFGDTGNPINDPSTGLPSSTGRDATSATSRLTAIEITKSEPSAEGEIMRGVHDFQTPYTLTVRNNEVNPTNGVVVDDYLPAALEFLGCGDVDNSAGEEYLGAGSLAGTPLVGCVAPATVETVNTDPDGAGPLPSGVYTHVVWTSSQVAELAVMTPGEVVAITYLAGIPMHANTLTWPGATPDTTGGQTANLDNNTGALTADEQLIRNGALATGTYDRPSGPDSAVTDRDVLDRTAESLRIVKSSPTSTFVNGDVLRYQLDVTASEYTDLTGLTVTDTLPDGLCPLDPSANLENATSRLSECDPTVDPAAAPANYGPSLPYSAGTQELASGAWTLTWTGLSVARGATTTITFPARVRQYYQQNFNNQTNPVASRDSLANTVAANATASVQPDGTPAGSVTDDSGTVHEAGGPSLDKKVAAPGPTSASPTCTVGMTWSDTISDPAAPGDRLCFKLRVDYPGNLFTISSRIVDFLPPGVVIDPATAPFYTPAHTSGAWTLDTSVPAVPAWTLDTIGDTGDTFEVIVTAIRVGPDDLANGQITGNLMKMNFANTSGTTFPLRDKVDIQNQDAQLSLLKGIAAVTHNSTTTSYSPMTDFVTDLTGGDRVDYQVDLINSGAEAVTRAEVWDNLPAGITCAMVSAISDAGTCTTAVTPNRITWNNIPVGAAPTGGTITASVTYSVTLPGTFAPGTALTNTAGIREYVSQTNIGGTYTYIPASNIDPTQPTAIDPADITTRGITVPAIDTATVSLSNAALSKDRVTSVTDTGNSATTQATIGETITYTVDLDIPEGTSLYAAEVIDTIPAGQILLSTPAPAFSFRTHPSGVFGALPGGLTTATTPTTVGVDFPASFTNAPGSSTDTLRMTYTVRVDDLPANVRGVDVTNSVQLSHTDHTGTTLPSLTANITTRIVTPAVTVTKTSDFGATAEAGEFATYALRVENPAGSDASPLYDVDVTDVVPPGLDPVDAANAVTATGPVPCPITANPTSGVPAPSCPSSPHDSGTWDSGARTLTWPTIAKIDPGTAVTLYYRVRAPLSAIPDTPYTNAVAVTGTSMPGVADGERSISGNTQATVPFAGPPPITKTGTPGSVSVGQEVTFTIASTIPAGAELFDARIVDVLPDGVVFNRYGTITCTAGCGSTLDGAITPFGNPASGSPTQNADGSTTIGWYLGDVVGYQVAGVPTARTYEITYVANVDDTYDGTGTPADGALVTAGTTITNSVQLGWNTSDQEATKPAAPTLADAAESTPVGQATTTVVAPHLILNKHVSCDGADSAPLDSESDTCATEPGDGPFTYTVTVTNTGTSAAYDTVVRDEPSSNLTSIGGITTSDGSITDGWSAADPDIEWTIPGPIAAGASVTLQYDASWKAPADLPTAAVATNTADVVEYHDAAAADRTGTDYFGDPVAFIARNDVAADTVTLTIAFPHVTIAKTNATDDEIGGAELLQPYGWKIVVTNDSSATAYGANITDTLPDGWTYDAGSAVISVSDPSSSAPSEPTISGQALTWATGLSIAPAGTLTVTFTATPQLSASPAANPQTNTAAVQVVDATGAPANATGSYSDGPDTAAATLAVPSLAIAKAPDCGVGGTGPECAAPVQSGQTDVPYTITITNTGVVQTRNLVITDVLPPEQSFVGGSATALVCAPSTPCTVADLPFPAGADATFLAAAGFAETGVVTDPGTGETTITWSLPNLEAGAMLQIRYRTNIAAPLVNGTLLTNTASVQSAEVTTPVADTGEHIIASRPYWFGAADPSYKSANPDSSVALVPGDTVTYTVHAVNSGNATAHDVLVVDAIPANTTFVAGSAASTAAGATIDYLVGGVYQSTLPSDPSDVQGLRFDVGTLTTSGPASRAEVSFAVRVNLPLVDGTTISNQASISSSEERALGLSPVVVGEPVAQGPITHTVDSRPDLALVKSVSDTSLDVVAEGPSLTYGLELTNTGSEDATGVEIEDAPPAGTALTAIDAGGADVSCSTDPGPGFTFGPCPSDLALVTMVRWSAPVLRTRTTLPTGPTRPSLRVGFTVDVAQPVINGTLLPNIATASSNETAADPTMSNEVATEIVSAPRLELVKTSNTSAAVGSGAQLTYTLNGRNTGSDVAYDVVLADTVPANTSYVAGSATSGAEFLVAGSYQATEPADPTSVQGLRWLDSSLDIGERIDGSFAVVVSQSIGRDVTQIRNVALINGIQRSAGPGGAVDPGSLVSAPLDEVADDVANPVRVARLTLAKRGPQRLRAGGVGAWYITVRNVGGVPATNVVITDIIPHGFSLVRSGPTPAISGGRATWTIQTLAPGETQTRRIRLRVDRSVVGLRTNVATVRAANVAGVAVRGQARTRVLVAPASSIPRVTG